MVDFPTLSQTSANEIPTLLCTWNLKKAPLSGGAFFCRALAGVPPPPSDQLVHVVAYTLHWADQTSHSQSFKTFLSDESIHGTPDTFDTFAPWNPTQSILDSTLWIPDSKRCSLDSNQNSLSYIPESKAHDSGFHSKISWIPDSAKKRKYPGVRNPDSLTWAEYFPWVCRPSDQCTAIALRANLI